jgi:hypothetical protein
MGVGVGGRVVEIIRQGERGVEERKKKRQTKKRECNQFDGVK